eukprot:10406056-Alexandrium_andersonii.AAC.1
MDCITNESKAARKKQGEHATAWVAYNQVFVHGDTVTQSKVILDWCRNNPDTKATRGRKRGGAERIMTEHNYKSSQSQSSAEVDAMLDYEAFVTRMGQLRSWSHSRADTEWNSLKGRPDIYQDTNGPRHSPLRLQIPSALVA